MGWFKRNKFFAMGLLLAVGLLGGAGYYDFASWQHNNKAKSDLDEIYNTLNQIAQQKPQAGNDKVDNIKIAQDQDKQLRDWIRSARNYFQPVTPIPSPTNGPVSNESFAGALHRTIDQLTRDAVAANVQLPPQYTFSFAAQNDKVRFSPGSVQPLSQQLGEVTSICEMLYAARINALEGIQRVPISDDDAQGAATDYIGDRPTTLGMAVLTPYQVTFRGFSAEIAQVLGVFATPPHGFIIKSIIVQPAGAATAANPATALTPVPLPVAPPPGRGGLQTVLNEQMLRVTMAIEVVKLTSGN